MMNIIALLFIGFSLGAAVLLVVGNILQQQNSLRSSSKAAGFLLIVGLMAIQSLHLAVLIADFDSLHSGFYSVLLYSIAPSFYFYSRQLLIADSHYQWRDVLHGLPLLFCVFLPYQWALPGAFLIGSGYVLWLANAVYFLRAQRQRFRLELLALGTLFVIAILVLVLGFIVPLLNARNFIIAYSILIGWAFFAVTLTLLRFPSITADVSEAVQAAYQVSTLKNIDKTAALATLQRVMTADKLYCMENLSLESLAEAVQLSPHQLSELINTEFQQGFSRYIRQHRIEEAKRLLLAEPTASVLSIGLSVGFNSQSNFYAAFREIVGMPPAQYRKNCGG